MSLQTVYLLQSTTDRRAVEGDSVRVDEGFGHTGRLYTFTIHASNFLGTVHIEASLVGQPDASDWFNLIAPITFPRPDSASTPGETATVGHTLTGNFARIRARMHRDGLPEMPTGTPNPYGFVDRILVNF